MLRVSGGGRDRINPWTYVLLVLLLIPFLFPLGWMFLSSLKTQVQNTAYPPVWVFTPTLGNYPATMLQLDANAIVTPDAAPANTTSINVSTWPRLSASISPC